MKKSKINLPNFKNKIIEQLYYYDYKIDQDIIKNIIALGDCVTPDLELVLADVIKNDEIYANSEGEIDPQVISHAMHLLGELKSESSLDKILNVYAQPKDFLEWWFCDSLTEEMWEILFRCTSVKQLNKLEHFMKNKNHYMYSRTAVGVALVQIALHHDEKVLDKVIKICREVLEHVSTNLMPDEFEENSYLSFLVSDVLDIISVKELNEEMYNFIKLLFEKKLVDEIIVGDIEGFDELIEMKRLKPKRKVKGIFKIYDSLTEQYDHDEYLREEYKDECFFDESLFKESSPILPNRKIGRNDPCFCGSNKKYKKCCYLVYCSN